MEWDKALAELLLREPEIRSWLALGPPPHDVSLSPQAEFPSGGVHRWLVQALRAVRPAIAS